LIAKLNGTSSTTILGGVNALAGSIDGSASVTGSASSNLSAKLLTQTHLVDAASAQLSTAISGVSTQIGGAGGTLAAKMTTQIGSVENGATVLNTAISDVSGLLGSGDSSLTSNTDLYRILNDANSGSSSGLIAKLNGTSSTTILGGVNALAGSIDGSASVTGSASSNLSANLLAQTHLVNGGASQLSTAISGVSTQIGGSGASLAAQLSDPVAGTTGLAGKIRKGHAPITSVNGFDCSSFDSATNLYDQLNTFVTIMSTSPAGTQIQIPYGTYNSLAAILAALGHD
jgi:hypothetical protein